MELWLDLGTQKKKKKYVGHIVRYAGRADSVRPFKSLAALISVKCCFFISVQFLFVPFIGEGAKTCPNESLFQFS